MNGLESYYDMNHYFRVENGTSGQKIIAKGLNGTYTNKGSGELYRSDRLLNAFKNFMEYFSVWVEDVRYVGSNPEHAEAAKQWAEKVVEEVNESNLIAFS